LIRIKFFFLLSFLLTGAVIRYCALDYGYPKYIHADEGHIINAVSDILKGEKVEKYGRPDRTVHYFNIAAIKVLSFVGIKELDKSQKYYLGRFVSLLFGVCSIVVAFYIGEQFINKCGLLFSFAVSFSPLIVENSRYIAPEIFNFFFSLMVILCSILYVNKRKIIFLLIGVLCCALNTAAKYPAVFTSLIIGLAIFIRYFEKNKFRKSGIKIISVWFLSAILFLIFFVMLFPQLITDFEGVYNKVIKNSAHNHGGVPNIGFFGQLAQYTYFLILDGGVLYLVLSLFGFFIITKNNEPKTIFFILIGLVILIFTSYTINSYMLRYAVMMSITPLFFWSYTSSYLIKRGFNSSNLLIKFSLLTIVGITCMFFLSKSIVDTKLLTGKPTSLMQDEYKQLNEINKKNAIFDRYTYGHKKRVNLEVSDLKKYKHKEFIIISERWYKRFFDKLHYKNYTNRREFYNYVKNNAEKVIYFSPTPTNFPKISFSPTSYSEYPLYLFDGIYIYRRLLFIANNWNKSVVLGPQIEIYRNPFYKKSK